MKPVIEVLNRELMRDLMGQAVAERGEEYVYSNPGPIGGCAYVHGTEFVTVGFDQDGNPLREERMTGEATPGCLIGAALIKGGIPMEAFVELRANYEHGADQIIDKLVRHGYIGACPEDVIDAVCIAQGCQDRGNAWGYAQHRFEESF